MFALRVEFLTGRCVAKETHYRAEWPPHPARLFSALVSALYVRGPSPDYDSERTALEWLQGEGPPEIAFSEAARRDVVTAYVPVNDLCLPPKTGVELMKALETALAGKAKKKPNQKTDPVALARKNLREAGEQALALLPERVGARKDRTFPTVAPEKAVVHFVWPKADAGDNREPLERLLSRVSYLGHSSSLVAIGIVESGWPDERWVPGLRGIKLRGVTRNQLQALDQLFPWNERMAQSYQLPCEPVSYGLLTPPREERRSAFSGDWVIFRKASGTDLSLLATLDLTHALRDAVIEKAGTLNLSPRAMALLRGKDASDRPLHEDHVAWIALPFVGPRGSRGLGDLKGVAVALPSFLDDRRHTDLADEILRALDLPETLPIGTLGAWQIQRAASGEDRAAINPRTWTCAAAQWATVTPLVLDRHPGHLFGRAARTEAQVEAKEKSAREAEECVKEACRRIRLPTPVEVRLSRFSSIIGVPPAHVFRPPPQRGSKPQRWHVHATIRFDDPVAGPVLLGAGSYLGYGLCRPIAAEGASQ